jgi:hypothetical protein
MNTIVGNRDDVALEPSARIDKIATTPKAKFTCGHEIKIDESHRVLIPSEADGVVFRVGFIAGALVAASGFTWFVIGAMPSPFGGSSGTVNSSARNPDSQKGDRLQTSNVITCEAASATISTHAQPQTTSIRKHLKDVEQRTTSTSAKDLQVQGKLTPVPETRPTTIEGWTIREVANGTVVLEGPNGAWQVTRGATVPGVGRIDSIFRWGGRLMVATTSGLISTP